MPAYNNAIRNCTYESGGIRNDLDAGDITWGEIYGIQPFGNQLIKVNLTGQDIRDILNQQWQKT